MVDRYLTPKIFLVLALLSRELQQKISLVADEFSALQVKRDTDA